MATSNGEVQTRFKGVVLDNFRQIELSGNDTTGAGNAGAFKDVLCGDCHTQFYESATSQPNG
jgi:hypothetical protein